MTQFLAAFLLAFAALLSAVEKSQPAVTRGRSTSSSKEISFKPLYLFSAKGRRDPFAKSTDLETLPENAHSSGFSVTELRLVGFIGDDEAPVALFKHRMGATTYTLKGGELYTPGNLKVPNVSGIVQPGRKVLLVQGDKKIQFTPFSSKRP